MQNSIHHHRPSSFLLGSSYLQLSSFAFLTTSCSGRLRGEGPRDGGARRLTSPIEIISRLPARSVCRFKCVSTTWRDLISHPVHRMKLPQTLSRSTIVRLCHGQFPISPMSLAQVSRWSPLRLASCQSTNARIFLLDSCNGLLLCRWCYGTEFSTGEWDLTDYHHFVCNPATKEWVALPGRWQGGFTSGF